MRVEIEIPEEFEEDFKKDKFEDALHRLSADAHSLAGNYEQEVAIMLINAFKGSLPAYPINQVVEELESKICTIDEDDVCEWHKVKNGNAYKCNTHAEIHDSRVLDWCKCPYCGKKIKVVEC